MVLIAIIFACITKTSQVKQVDSASQTFLSASQLDSLPSSSMSAPSAKPSATPKASSNSLKVIDGFVKVSDIDSNILIDLKYATTNNFTHQKVYPTDICVLRLSTAEKLAKANAEFEKMGYRIKIWDAYRPLSVQKIFWSIEPNAKYVANPATGGSIHNRGCAVDITLVDKDGNDLSMPSGFDDFTEKAYPSNPDMSSEARANLDILTKVMTENGFVTITTEWWHFEDSNKNKYPVSDVDISLFK